MALAIKRLMNKLILVVDGTRARWFRIERRRLIEHADLVCPEHKLMDRDRYTETKTGRWERGRLGPTHSFDDHRNAHDREVERRFAHEIAEKTEEATGQVAPEEIVIVGDNRMLGLLRNAFDPVLTRDIARIEVRKNIAQQTRDQIQDALAEEGLLDPRPRLSP
jgi:protein required for attachment to host cells